jgi:hypothetical protein
MSNLKSLTFTTVSPISNDPKLIRRQRLIERLEEQRKLAKDPSYAPIVKRWKKAEDGSRISVEQTRRLKPWWRTDANGNVVLIIKSGLKTLEFEKGKAGIAVGALDRLDGVFGTLIAATKAGELDAALEAASGSGSRGVTRGKNAV